LAIVSDYKRIKMANDMLIGTFVQMSTLLELFSEEEDKNPYNKELENIIIFLNKRSIKRPIKRLKGYVEDIISYYNDEQFKSHFRFV